MNPELLSKLATLQAGMVSRLEGTDDLPPSWHLWKQNEIDAITIALASQRPLLVRGEPGTGKSQLARAAASVLQWQLHCATLHARSEAQDLLYQFDAVRRLADAQVRHEFDENSYWQPQALWCALDWDSAQQYGSLRGTQKTHVAGHVVLIDEIDKAPSDVPNGLLEVLGARYFDIAALARRVPEKGKANAWPLVIITTNEERELPAAFLRRCMVLTHDAEQDGGYQAFLVQHGKAHFGAGREGATEFLAQSILEEAARQLVFDRQNAKQAQLVAPGLAEYLDLLYALYALAPDDSTRQMQWLAQLQQYAFLKNRVEAGDDARLKQTADGKRQVDIA